MRSSAGAAQNWLLMSARCSLVISRRPCENGWRGDTKEFQIIHMGCTPAVLLEKHMAELDLVAPKVRALLRIAHDADMIAVLIGLEKAWSRYSGVFSNIES